MPPRTRTQALMSKKDAEIHTKLSGQTGKEQNLILTCKALAKPQQVQKSVHLAPSPEGETLFREPQNPRIPHPPYAIGG
eukprot:CAMPEP_0197694484 /NCGR_PEP_ID=MMETSP1338-20131121/113877_1 /TAXON_ID=43686 ORGANISM="Pelagodinium beii, Strain RCC1491" /NCGR_SAMPLE_ID=MMETSP1338 /ASSEMBLY_ACC=CAM_ASM_000754 /LENGTH=78 /DNA_ID=CAMNT_0043277331 /DNA_START=53 /DNA_END=286 /DNA_ORIENTATION=-